ncbi:STAS domain-containing protein [Micromonospora soli]|uniref:STAS domain-containing protein n=1 Tax=Micromonospora sp. NBRC 110009 TaxID=3061627 RepID=UPI00267301D9|nr:STAS domain-containing protein [Micromonospora sp. NBRC 110009]WKT98671.1 STAS domain-containing protein [Micromonospora sp. NBRC 110009]
MEQTWQSETTVSDGTAVVTLFGELDIAAASPLGDVLQGAIALASRVQVDLARVSFIDSTVLSAFVNAHGRATDMGVSLALVKPTGHVRRVLAMTGILPLLAEPDSDG